MKTLTLLIQFLLLANLAYSQEAQTNQVNKEAVSKLSFIMGNWKGEGWIMGTDGKRHSFMQTETIRFKLDSTALVIEGLGTDNGKVIHNAMAILTYNNTGDSYHFQSYLANGRGGRFKAELLNGKLYWYPNETMRYIIYLNEKGQWYETGEIKREGQQWFQFFEMILDKQ